MAKYDGLIIPRSYSDYLNKTDGATLSQMLDSIGGTFDASPTPNSVKPARSGGIFAANAVITSNNATLTGVTISEGSVVRVLFTADLTGSNATTGLTLTYNGTAYAVKVGKNGALVALTAHLIEESYIYLQAYTTFELAFDGSQFVVMGNPVVISNADFSIMADGSITYTKTHIDKHNCYIFYVDNYTERGNKFCGVIEPNTTIERAFTDFARNGNYYYFLQIQAFNETTGSINICDRLTVTNVTYPLGNNAETQIDRTNNVVRFVNNTAYPLQLSFEVIYSR